MPAMAKLVEPLADAPVFPNPQDYDAVPPSWHGTPETAPAEATAPVSATFLETEATAVAAPSATAPAAHAVPAANPPRLPPWVWVPIRGPAAPLAPLPGPDRDLVRLSYYLLPETQPPLFAQMEEERHRSRIAAAAATAEAGPPPLPPGPPPGSLMWMARAAARPPTSPP